MSNDHKSILSRWRKRNLVEEPIATPRRAEERASVLSQPRRVQPVQTTASSSTSSSKAKVILVMNSKGGSGKTTVSTNLATQLSARRRDHKVVLVDHDPQGSSARWLRARSKRHRLIEGIFPAKDNVIKFKRTWRVLVDTDATHVIVDSAAGLSSFDLTDRIRESDLIIVPVMPSAIDIAATSDFVSKVFINPAYVKSNKKMAVVANGVNKGMHNFEKLERFLFSLRIPFISVFSDHSHYLVAAERGCGVNELPVMRQPFHDLPEWDKLIEWVEEVS